MTTPPKSPKQNEINETNPQLERERLIAEAKAKAAQVPEGGFRSSSDPVTTDAPYRPPPQQPVDPKLQQAFMLGYNQSQKDHYLQGFIGAVIIISGGFLAWKGGSWLWGCVGKKGAKPTPAIEV